MATHPFSSSHDGRLSSNKSKSPHSNASTIPSAPTRQHQSTYTNSVSVSHPSGSLFADIDQRIPLSPSPPRLASSKHVLTHAPTPFLRKGSEPVIGAPSRITLLKSNSYQEQLARHSLLPMPPEYIEGSHWTLLSLRVLAGPEEESRLKWLRVEVVKKSLKVDGRWGRERPFVVERRWEEWVDFRDQLVSKFPVTEQILPRLTKTSLFSSITTSKKSTLHSHLKDLEQFVFALLSCSRTVRDSKLVQAMFQTEEMRRGTHQVEYETDRPGQQSSVDAELDDDPFSKVTPICMPSATFHQLECFKFPAVVEEESKFVMVNRVCDTPLAESPHAALPVRRPPIELATLPEASRKGRSPIVPPSTPGTHREPHKSPERLVTFAAATGMGRLPHPSQVHQSTSSHPNSSLARPKTSDPASDRHRHGISESDPDTTVKVSRSIRRAQHDPSSHGQADLISRGRLGSVPVTRSGNPDPAKNQALLPIPAYKRRNQRLLDRPMTSGSVTASSKTDVYGAHSQPEWTAYPRRYPQDSSSSLSSGHRRVRGERTPGSVGLDTQTIPPTPPSTVVPPQSASINKVATHLGLHTPHTIAALQARRKHSDVAVRQARPLKEDFEPMWKQNIHVNHPSEVITAPNRLVKPRPGIRHFKSMQDIRGSPAPFSIDVPIPPSSSSHPEFNLSKFNARPVGLAISTVEHEVSIAALERGRRTPPARQNTIPSLDRGGSALRAGRHAIRAGSVNPSTGFSPTRKLRSRGSVTSSSSSFGSLPRSCSASSPPRADHGNPKQHRSDSISSIASLARSDASAPSPLQPVTPGHITSQARTQANVVIDANNTSLLENGCSTSMQYVFDQSTGRFFGHHTVPPAPFFPLPPVPVRQDSPTEIKRYICHTSRPAFQRRPHTAGDVRGGKILAGPFVLNEARETKTLDASSSRTIEERNIGSVMVKVTHVESGNNIVIKVPKSIGLSELKARIQSKLVEGAEVCLPDSWDLMVLLDKTRDGHILCSDQELNKLMLDTPSSSRKITLKLV